MWKDPIIGKVRKNREKLFSRFDFNLEKFSAYIMDAQKMEKRKVISLEEMKSSRNV